MSWQTVEALRDHSRARGATRTVGFVLASYAQKDGSDVRPSIATICEKAKVARKAAVDGRRWFLDHGEAVQTGLHPTRSGSPIPILDFRPLHDLKGSQSKPLDGEEKGSPIEPLEAEGFAEDTPKGSPSKPPRVRSTPPKGSLSEPEAAEKLPTKLPNETKAAAAASSSDSDYEQEVQALYEFWLKVTEAKPNTRLTTKRRSAIDRALGSYEPEELKQAIGNWKSSDWFAGRKARDGKVRNDLTDLLATDDVVEELRDAGPTQSDSTSAFLARFNAGRGSYDQIDADWVSPFGGLTDPALAKINARPVDEPPATVESGLSPTSTGAAQPPAAQVEAERRADQRELASLEGQLPTTRSPNTTRECIEDLRERLGMEPLSDRSSDSDSEAAA